MRQTCGQRSGMSVGSTHRALAFYFHVQICHIFPISICRGQSDLGRRTILVLANRMPPRIGKFRQILRQNTFFHRKLPPCSDILFASTEVVHRPRSDFPPHFDVRNTYQIRMENQIASARRLLPADTFERWPQVGRVKITFGLLPMSRCVISTKTSSMECAVDWNTLKSAPVREILNST